MYGQSYVTHIRFLLRAVSLIFQLEYVIVYMCVCVCIRFGLHATTQLMCGQI